MLNIALQNQNSTRLIPKIKQKEVSKHIILAMGANLPGVWGKPIETLRFAIEQLHTHNTKILNISPVYETDPVGATKQCSYVNNVVVIQSYLSPGSLLRKLKQLERASGRQGQAQRWSARTLDIDIIDYQGRVTNWDYRNRKIKPINNNGLILPHGYIHLRPFVMTPLADVCPNWRHPVFKLNIPSLLKQNCTNYLQKGKILRKIENFHALKEY